MDHAIGALLGELDRLADRARHPALTLDRFTDDYRDGPAVALRPEQELLARRRRAAVIYAANLVVDECLHDQQTLAWNEDTGLPLADGEPGDSFVWRFFPPRFRGAYDAAFFGKVLVTAVKVGYDLAPFAVAAPRPASPRSSSSMPCARWRTVSSTKPAWAGLGGWATTSRPSGSPATRR